VIRLAAAVAAVAAVTAVLAIAATSALRRRNRASRRRPEGAPARRGRVSSAPKVGYVDGCQTSFGGIGGAQAVGPWVDEAAKTWDRTKKLSVQGTVKWPQARYTTKVAGTKRTFSFNDLPVGHTTGSFPIGSGDPAAPYDRNPNSVAAQTVAWSVPPNPKQAAMPSCTSMGPIIQTGRGGPPGGGS